MLIELKQTHENLLKLLSELERLSAEAFDDRAVTDVRWRLTKESNRRKKLLETIIYPHLLSTATQAEVSRVSALQNEGAELRARSSAHIGTWTRKRIALDWPGYQRASKEMRALMRERIFRERSVLYPLLDRTPGHLDRELA